MQAFGLYIYTLLHNTRFFFILIYLKLSKVVIKKKDKWGQGG